MLTSCRGPASRASLEKRLLLRVDWMVLGSGIFYVELGPDSGREDRSINIVMENNFVRAAVSGAVSFGSPPGAALARWRRWGLPFAAAVLVAFVAYGCSSQKKVSSIDSGDDYADSDAGEPLPAPIANVQISYSRPNDSLERVTVSKYFGAEVIAKMQSRSGRTASVIRFDGGVPVWEIKADRSLAGRIADIGSAGWAVKNLEYGKLPPHFSQILPDEGPPEPLERGSFYVFSIDRSSGTTSYEAVKVLADGSLQAYAAQPRAGSSFLLCCGLNTDFSEPVILPEEINPDDMSGQDSSQGGGDAGGRP
jgi:hypothetical protein